MAWADGASAQSEPLVDNVFFQAQLTTAIEDISAQTGVNIVADPSVQGVVSATIEFQTVEDALEILLAGSGFRFVRRPKYILVYNPDIRTDLFAEISVTEIIILRNTPAETVRELLVDPLRKYVRADQENGRLVVTAPNELAEIIRNDVAAIDRPNTEETVFIALTYISAQNARDLLPERLQRFVRVDQQRNSVAITGPVPARRETVTLLQRLDRPLPPTNVDTRNVYGTSTIKLDNTTAQTVMNLLPASLADYVRADETTNTVSVNAPPAIARQIRADIAEFDQPRQHIMLEAQVVVLDTAALLNLGTEFEAPGLAAGFNRTDGSTDVSEIALGYTSGRTFTNALTLTLNLLSANNQATIVASPQVLAQDGIVSEIRVTTAEFFQILTESNNDTFIRTDLEEIETGTVLRIAPQVGRDRTLTLSMELEVSDVVARGEQNLPVVNRRTVQNTVQIQDGGTAAVAGLSDARNQQGRSGIPGLISLPIFGRTDNSVNRTQQVAIFVTATIVDEKDHQFRNGRSRPPALGTVNEEVFRAELARVLDTIGQSE